jgi:hypothetical protein
MANRTVAPTATVAQIRRREDGLVIFTRIFGSILLQLRHVDHRLPENLDYFRKNNLARLDPVMDYIFVEGRGASSIWL